MTLEEIINEYLTESYSIFKYLDKDGRDIKVRFLFDTHRDYLDKYLSFYKSLPNLTEVVVFACDGVFKLTNNGIDYFIRHNHQEVFTGKSGNLHGVPYETAKIVRNNLMKKIIELQQAQDFDTIFEIVQKSRVLGFGELSIYDTSIRISSFKDIEPDKVYLHAGARAGAELLELKGLIASGLSQKSFIEMKELPVEFQKMKEKEVEHFLCSKKDRLKNHLDD